jgi:hypothetical protein
MSNLKQKKRLLAIFFLPCLIITFSACVSHLYDAKYFYAEGQRLSRNYQGENAVAAFKKARKKAELEVNQHPSSQAYMIKGLAELNLEIWDEAEDSFLKAFAYGFEKGEEWAEHLSLFGLASSLQELGLEGSSAQIYEYLLSKSKVRPITRLAAQRYTGISLRLALSKEGKERSKMLSSLLKTAEKLSDKDLSCGYYHYLQSQIFSHLCEYRKSFEQAVMARELGLPSQELLRDNDNQVIYIYRNLKNELPLDEWKQFTKIYLDWIKRWRWPEPEIPDWQKE